MSLVNGACAASVLTDCRHMLVCAKVRLSIWLKLPKVASPRVYCKTISRREGSKGQKGPGDSFEDIHRRLISASHENPPIAFVPSRVVSCSTELAVCRQPSKTQKEAGLL